MQFIVFLVLLVPSVLSSYNEYWITPCGHVYKKAGHPLKIIRTAETLVRLKHHFKTAHEYISDNTHFGILEELPHDQTSDSYVIPATTLDLYNNIGDVRRLLSLLPTTYRSLQDLAFALKIVHDELSDKEEAVLKNRHVAVKGLMDRNAELLCELDFAMNRNNIEFFRIDQLTLSQEVMASYSDETFTHIKHSHILKEYRAFIKHVSTQVLKVV